MAMDECDWKFCTNWAINVLFGDKMGWKSFHKDSVLSCLFSATKPSKMFPGMEKIKVKLLPPFLF